MSPTSMTYSLPPELWKLVLREATYEPNSGDPGYEPFAEDPLDFVPTPETRAPKQAKRSAVCVCKTWRRLALPLLYESLVIDSERRAQQIHAALDLPPDPAAAPDAPLDRGALVRQLYVRANWDRSNHDTDIGGHLADIIARCPGLAVFKHRFFAISAVVHPAFDALRASPAAQSLRKLDLGTNPAFSEMRLWWCAADALRALPRLETLVVPTVADPAAGLLRMPADVMRAPCLRTLAVSWDLFCLLLAHPAQLDMPALQAVHILPLPFGKEAIDAPTEPGALLCLVASLEFRQPATWSPAMLRAAFAFLARFLNLQVVCFPMVEMDAPEEPLVHPSLACIAIMPIASAPMRRFGNPAVNMVEKTEASIEIFLAGHFPKLRQVRIVGIRGRVIRNKTEWVAEWTQRLGERGIALTFSQPFL